MFKTLFYIKIVLAIIVCYGFIYLLYRLTSTNYQISPVDAATKKLQLDVYMETRCPDTEIFVADQLKPTMKSLGDYVTLKMYPYGKAEETFDGEKWKFSCQHGPLECQGNTILGCVISMTNQTIYVPFTACLMKNVAPTSNYKQCCRQFNIDIGTVNKCAEGPKGNQIQHQNAVATSSLTPKLQFIPWIIVDKVFSNSNQDKAITDLKGLLCGYLKTPAQCK